MLAMRLKRSFTVSFMPRRKLMDGVFWRSFAFIIAVIVVFSGCSTNPLSGWTQLSGRANEVIFHDYVKYIELHNINHEPWGYEYFEDGSGKHAIEFDVPHGGSSTTYILIYDKSNVRIRVITHYNPEPFRLGYMNQPSCHRS
jgi:hypothetical protein